VMEQPDGTFAAWSGRATIGVDYIEDTPEHAPAGALFAPELQERPREVLVPLFGLGDADARDSGYLAGCLERHG